MLDFHYSPTTVVVNGQNVGRWNVDRATGGGQQKLMN